MRLPRLPTLCSYFLSFSESAFFPSGFFVCLYRLCAFMHMHIAFFQGRNDFFSWCVAVLLATSYLSPHFLLLSSLLNLYSVFVNENSDLQLNFSYISYSHTLTNTHIFYEWLHPSSPRSLSCAYFCTHDCNIKIWKISWLFHKLWLC